MLSIENVTKRFGGLVAVNNVSCRINRGEIVGLIGPNGAGKTTLFNIISGFYRPDSGVVKFKGKNIIGLRPFQICHMGIGRTFQIPRPFKNLTVFENVLAGVLFGKIKEGTGEERQRVIEILGFLGLTHKADTLAKDLTLVELKRLEIARAMATNPELLLLDEIAAGLNPKEVDDVVALIKRINEEKGISIFLIEHVIKTVAKTCNKIIVLHYGNKIAEGTMEEISSNDKVIEAYLGKRYKLGETK